jgi:hypothetical protein
VFATVNDAVRRRRPPEGSYVPENAILAVLVIKSFGRLVAGRRLDDRPAAEVRNAGHKLRLGLVVGANVVEDLPLADVENEGLCGPCARAAATSKRAVASKGKKRRRVISVS